MLYYLNRFGGYNVNEIGYFKELNNYEALADKLSDEELINCFLDMKNNDYSARRKIIEHNLKLVVYEVNSKFSNSLCDKDDLISAGVIGLIKAVDSYDITKNIKFATYASRCIDNEIRLSFRKVRKHLNLLRLDNYVNCISDTTFVELLCDEKDFFENVFTKEEYEMVRKIISELPLKEKIIVQMYFGFNGRKYTQVEMAKEVNISQSYLSRVIKDILNKIKNRLIEEHVIIEKHLK